MIPTLVIGLREGLEAALIVGIIAAFLKRNGRRLTAMWVGVGIAVGLSIAVGVALAVVEKALPQAQQEGMESIIGAVAVIFVTGMIVWMNTHSRGLKKELEREAGEALQDGHAWALAGMAFLAVLKEGFETSVFLLATFTASTNPLISATGAVIGVAIAVGIGIGLYLGGIKLNLSKFFRITGVFLVFVAAGLVITTLRTAHEAGWLNGGQQATVNLYWLVKPNSVQAALITGVLGIPADPRLVEVIGWFAFVVPVALFVYWPAKRRAKGVAIAVVQFSVAAAVALVAVVLAVGLPGAQTTPAPALSLVASSGTDPSPLGTAQLAGSTLTVHDGSASSSYALGRAKAEQHDGVDAEHWHVDDPAGLGSELPSTLTLDQLVRLAGGRLPVGVNAQQDPGPFAAAWASHSTLDVWASDGVLLDASQDAKVVVTISGGGLDTSRSLAVPASESPLAGSWTASDASLATASAAISERAIARTEHAFWSRQLPIGLGVAALVIAIFGFRSLGRARREASDTPTTPQPPRTSDSTATTIQRNTNSYAIH